jgi:hypothetical protein
VLILPSGKRIKTPASVELPRDRALTLFVEKEGYRSSRVYLDRETDWWALLPFAANLYHLVPDTVDITLEPRSDSDAVITDSVIEPSQHTDDSDEDPAAKAPVLVSNPGSDPAPSTTGSVFDQSQPTGGADRVPAVGTPDLMKVDESIAIATQRVPAGRFFSGCSESADTECFENEKPGTNRELDAFEIDATEVTIGAFRDCVLAGGCAEPKAGDSCNWGRSERDWHPVNCVDWNQATAYCDWKGKRLPTEWEWEKAARGTDGRIYPWGNEPADCRRTVIEDDAGSACGQGHTTFEVGSRPSGHSPYDVLDMAGNVWEWTSSPSSEPSILMVRGGSWFDIATLARASFRGKYTADSQIPSLGFRCALSVDAVSSTPTSLPEE